MVKWWLTIGGLTWRTIPGIVRYREVILLTTSSFSRWSHLHVPNPTNIFTTDPKWMILPRGKKPQIFPWPKWPCDWLSLAMRVGAEEFPPGNRVVTIGFQQLLPQCPELSHRFPCFWSIRRHFFQPFHEFCLAPHLCCSLLWSFLHLAICAVNEVWMEKSWYNGIRLLWMEWINDDTWG